MGQGTARAESRTAVTALLTAAALLACATVAVLGQTAAGPSSFEVASIKPADPTNANNNKYAVMFGVGTCNRQDPGRFMCTYTSLLELILMAHNLTLNEADEVIGPPWLKQDKYDVVAAIPRGSNRQQVNAMILSLLAERFGLALHRETRDLPAYELTVAKGGLKMRAAEKPSQGPQSEDDPRPPGRLPTDKDGLPILPPGTPRIANRGSLGVSARMQSIADLVRLLESKLDRPLVDKTGLTGTYDFTLIWPLAGTDSAVAPEPPYGQGVQAGPSLPIADLLAAVRSQLGLNLVPAKSPVSVLVVDHVNRTPKEN
jgi:uncharacterized protein (TIGR03435 family)